MRIDVGKIPKLKAVQTKNSEMNPRPYCILLEPSKSNQEIDLHKVRLGLSVQHSTLESLSDILLRTPSGCLVVDLIGSETALISQLVNVFLQSHYSVPIIVVAEHVTSEEKIAMVRAGACEAVERNSGQLESALRRAIAIDNDTEYGPSKFRLRFSTLTAREREVITLFLRGQNAKTIAKRLSVTVQTIDKHRIRALRKFGMRSLVDMHARVTKSLLTGFGIALDPRPTLEHTSSGVRRIDAASALAGFHTSAQPMVNDSPTAPQ